MGIKKATIVLCFTVALFSLQNAANAEETGIKDRQKAYTLTRVDAPSENVITKYELKDGIMTPVYYRVELSKTEYGTGDSSKYYKWTSIDGKRTLTETTNSSEAQITAKYDTTNIQRQINNNVNLDSIDGVFLENKKTVYDGEAYGGAVHNDYRGTIDKLNADFIGNNLFSSPDCSATAAKSFGGAVHNEGAINVIEGNFINNYAFSIMSAFGGAISNYGTIGNITGNFIGNYALSKNHTAIGGAIYNEGTVGNITGDFIGNYASHNGETTYDTYGGAISNSGTIGNITGDFIGNYASQNGETSYDTFGGAISNSGTIGNITGDFIGNYASSAYDDFYKVYGGAIFNKGTIGEIDENGNIIGGIINSSFLNNYVETEKGEANGGAIYSDKDIQLIAKDSYISVISGNYVKDKNGKRNEAIYVNSATAKLTLNTQTEGSFLIDDQINGESGYNLTLTGDETGKIILNNDIKNANITLDKTNIYLSNRDDVFNESQSLTMNSGSLSMVNNTIGTMNIPSLTIKGNTNFAADVDLANATMDRITADTYTIESDAMLNVNYLNLLNDAKDDITKINFASSDYASNVAYTGASPIAYSPIYKYGVAYDPRTGIFTFDRASAGNNSNNQSDNYNPSVLAPSVVTQAGAYTTQLQTFNYAFQHADNFMAIPYLERLSIKNRNKYALSPTSDATDVGTFSPLLTKEEDGGFWVKPYASFENIPLKNGPKVSNINYGTLIGYDSDLKSIKHGWDRVLTGYLGYNGASQRYGGVDTYQNGGILGGTTTLYKGNFFNATTLSVGATVGDAKGMYGSENYTMLLAGIGNKTGYNFEFKEGRIILQPSMLISYTFVNTFDYTNAAGVRINSDPLNAIQLAPGIKLIGNTKNGWQPYMGVSMVWNLLDKTKVTANDVRLPEMSIKPYVQYGVGLQKRFKDRFLAFGQAMIHNGGRNGISLSGGIRWIIGKE